MTLKADILTDLDTVLNTDEFADDAVYYPASAADVTLKVIFSREYQDIMGMEGYRYWIEAKTSDVEDMAPGETIVIGGVTYKVKEPPRAGDGGMSIVELSID